MMRAGAGILLLAATLLGGARAAEAQCSMCRTALEGSDEGRALAGRMNEGILLLLGAPLGVALAVGAAMARSRRRLENGAR